MKKLIGESEKVTERGRLASLDIVIGEDPAEEPRVFSRHGIAQKQALDSRHPGVFREGIGAPLKPVLQVDSPPDPHIPDPPGDKVHFRAGDPEGGMHGWRFQYGQYARGRYPLTSQIQQAEERFDNSTLIAHASVRDAVRDSFEIALRVAEDRVDKRGIGFDVGGHHQDVPGHQLRIGLEHCENAVVQYLDLSHGTVTGVDLYGIVPLRDRDPVAARSARVPEIQDIGLYSAQQAGAAGVVENRDFTAVKGCHQVEEVSPHDAHGGKERISAFQVKLLRGQPGRFAALYSADFAC